MRIEQPGDVEGALKEAFAMKDRLVFLDFITDQTENVYPMIAAGKGHHEIAPVTGEGAGLMRTIISLLMENEAGALSRVAGLFSARGYNIESADRGADRGFFPVAHDRGHHRFRGDHRADHQTAQQAGRCGQAGGYFRWQSHRTGVDDGQGLHPVGPRSGRNSNAWRTSFAVVYLDVTDESYIIELTGNGSKLDAFLGAIDAELILETVRSGATGIARGSRALRV